MRKKKDKKFSTKITMVATVELEFVVDSMSKPQDDFDRLADLGAAAADKWLGRALDCCGEWPYPTCKVRNLWAKRVVGEWEDEDDKTDGDSNGEQSENNVSEAETGTDH